MTREDAEYLAAWQRAPREPLFYSDEPHLWRVLAACWQQEPLTFDYWGGTEPGARRTVVPRSVFTVPGYGGIWCEAWCTRRNALRTFRLDRMLIAPPCPSPS